MKTRDIVFGLGFGDEGKGQTVCNISNKRYKETGITPAIVRYSGGCQNAHNVIWQIANMPEQHHTFSQIGASGPLNAKTYNWKTVPVDIEALIKEIWELSTKHPDANFENIFTKQFFHNESLLIIPIHAIASRFRESSFKHGSTGRGRFEANKFAELYPDHALRMEDFLHVKIGCCYREVIEKYNAFLRWLIDGMPVNGIPLIDGSPFEHYNFDILSYFRQFPKLQSFHDHVMFLEMEKEEHLVFEGGQGVLLDKDFGFFPNVTFSKSIPVMAKGIIETLDEEKSEKPEVNYIGVTRSFGTRHGNGYLPFEYRDNEAEYKRLFLMEQFNVTDFAGKFRFGAFCNDTFEYAMELYKLHGIDPQIRWTFADHVCTAYVINQNEAVETANIAYLHKSDEALRRMVISGWVERMKYFEGACEYRTPLIIDADFRGTRVENF